MSTVRFSSYWKEYPGTRRPIEYPLFTAENAKLCPDSRYVAGTSHSLCCCNLPSECPGVIAAVKQFYPDQVVEE